ncbi:MAG: sigma 54-interacting transcriptional regulator, partial [Myxococcales bacterium]|nr:sigma 54-interacting transcriptional regulator [Myxococcales bacterium]
EFECAGPVQALGGQLFGSLDEPGALHRAEGGSLLLRHVSELPIDMHAELLRAIDGRPRRGGERTRELRVLCTSDRDLEEEVARGRFSEALRARIGSLAMRVPPLRERLEDLPLLAAAFLEGSALEADDPALLSALASHDWPHNIEELRRVCEALRAVPSGRVPIAPGHGADATAFDPGQTYRQVKADFEERFERRYVRWLLERHGGNVSAAARAAGMDRKYLHKLARKHGVRG